LLDLNQDDRNLILLYAWAELSYEELAEALDLPLGTVRSRLSRTRSRLRAALAPPETMVAGDPERA
jgi:RNA polymerase sigma-70 factor, ECF subfamily